MRAVSVKRSICPCGFPTLDESVPIGKEYAVRPNSERELLYICGGCGAGQHVRCVEAEPGGYLPVGLLKLKTND